MTPTISLILICGLVGVAALYRWIASGVPPSPGRKVSILPPGALKHLSWCVAAGVAVWLVNFSLLPESTDRVAILGLLLIEAGLGWLVSSALLYSRYRPGVAQQAAPAPLPQDENQDGPGGVIRLRKFNQTRGVLSAGTMVVWNERRGCWSSLEAALEDERNALAG